MLHLFQQLLQTATYFAFVSGITADRRMGLSRRQAYEDRQQVEIWQGAWKRSRPVRDLNELWKWRSLVNRMGRGRLGPGVAFLMELLLLLIATATAQRRDGEFQMLMLVSSELKIMKGKFNSKTNFHIQFCTKLSPSHWTDSQELQSQ